MTRVRYFIRSLVNFRKGYRWSPIQQCRDCDHTTPFHYPSCRRNH